MNRYRVVFKYGAPRPEDLPDDFEEDDEGYFFVERDVEIESVSKERAAIAALQRKLLPARYIRDEPIYWSELLAGEDHWITVVDSNTLAWGEEDNTTTIYFEAELLSEDSD